MTSLAVPVSRAAETLNAIRDGLRTHALLYSFALFVLTAAVLESQVLGIPLDLQMVMIFSGPVLLVLLVMMIIGLAKETVRLARTGHQGSLALALGAKLRDDYFTPTRISNGLHAVIFMTVYMVGYTFIKRAIPLAVPFQWDVTFMEWDKALHFGTHPFQWLSPLLDHAWITLLLNVNYNAWFFVMFTLWFWQGFAKHDTELRQRFLLGFTLTWFLGTCVLGTLLSSVGPCFYGKLIAGPDPYVPLMSWLDTANTHYPIWSLNVMDELWRNYETGTGVVNGISAMPSMHVGTSVLFALLGFASGHRWIGWLLTGFASLIFIGSIHLAWHYAIDGYAGAAVAFFGWWAAGKLVKWDRSLRGV
ncbi:phosphatase PAP2 family protein [Aestuariivirga sp.]|uniref:phosphatase PAP2 family protein n=1 Tax=Aestuariivirga sp. TaxID=2650926 RepID=UPI0035939D1F